MHDRSSIYCLVNWEQSMEIGLTDFRQTEDFFINRIRDARAQRLKSYNYGILPSPDGKGTSSGFDINEQVTGKVEILLVDPYRRVPTGEPSLEESQARHPDAGEFYGLSITPQGKMNHDQLGMHHLVIGRVRLRGGRYEVDTDYIPPVTSMSSHPDLISYYQRFGSRLSEIEKASKAIIAKINNRPTKSPVGEHLKKISEEIMRYIAGIFFLYRNTGREAAPEEIVNYFSTLAHVCYVGLNFLENSEKEQLLNYFYEWSDMTPGTFEEERSSLRNLKLGVNLVMGKAVRTDFPDLNIIIEPIGARQVRDFQRNKNNLIILDKLIEMIIPFDKNVTIKYEVFEAEKRFSLSDGTHKAYLGVNTSI